MYYKNKRSFASLFLIVAFVFVPAQILLRAETISDNNTEEVMESDNAQVNEFERAGKTVNFVASDFDPSEWEMDTTNTDAYVLQQYIGNKTNIYIPGKHTDGKHVIIDSLYERDAGIKLFWGVKSNKIKNIKIEAVDGIKVKILDSDAYGGFRALYSMKTADFSGLDVSNITNMSAFFSQDVTLTDINMTGWDTGNVIDMSHMFFATDSLKEVDISHFDTSNVINMNGMFYNTLGLTTLDISNFDTSNVELMENMFASAQSLTTLDISGFDTSNVKTMRGMFANSSNLRTINLNNLNTSKVTNMSRMFQSASQLEKLDLSSFDTSNVTDMYGMFNYTYKLETLDLSSFDTSKVTNMHFMFDGIKNLKKLDLSSFDTRNVTNMHCMFLNVPRLEILDLSSFDTSNVTDMSFMFYNEEPQERLVISDDSRLLNYDYQSDNNIPRKITTLDANGGQFADGTTQKEYVFPSVAVSPASILPPEEDRFLQQVPENKAKTFSGWHPGFPDSILSMKDTVYYATWKVVPKLTIEPQIVELQLNDPSWEITTIGTDGVSWSDPLDTSGVFQPVTIVEPTSYQDDSETAVDIHKPGVYHVNYVVTNSSGETVEGKRVYTVGAQAVGTEYALFAHDFDRALTDAMNDSDAQIILNADAQAILLADGMTEGTVELLSKTGYGTITGTYPITFSVSEENTVHTNVNACIYDEVMPSLPATGETTYEVIIVSILILCMSLIGLIRSKQKRKN